MHPLESEVIKGAREWQDARHGLAEASIGGTWGHDQTISLGRAECRLRDAIKALNEEVNFQAWIEHYLP